MSIPYVANKISMHQMPKHQKKRSCVLLGLSKLMRRDIIAILGSPSEKNPGKKCCGSVKNRFLFFARCWAGKCVPRCHASWPSSKVQSMGDCICRKRTKAINMSSSFVQRVGRFSTLTSAHIT